MIPVYLKMEGFLTFKKPTLINFEEFADEGIFLVSGPTGSGKTSIFDAITYALYGVAATSQRETRELRSQLIDDEDDFSVEFMFRSGPHEYVVTRWQSGQRAGKVRMVIDGDDENPLTKVGEIKEKIVEVLGLNADQFCKIVMLPQGEFRNFLSASSRDKSDILRKLFDTEHYAEIRDAIHTRLGQIIGQVTRAKTIIDSVKGISEAASLAADPDEILTILTREWQAAQEEAREFKTRLELLRTKKANLELRFNEGRQTNLDLEEESKLAENIRQALAAEDRHREDLRRAGQLNAIRPLKVQRDALLSNQINLETLKAKEQDLSAQLEESQRKLKAASADYDLNPGRQERLTAISGEITEMEKSQQDLNQLKEIQEKVRQAETQTAALHVRVREHGEWIQSREKLTADLEAISRAQLEKNQTITDLREEFTDLRDLAKAVRSWQKLRDDKTNRETELRICKEAMDRLRAEAQTAGEHAREIREHFARQGLGQYVHSLADGEPCPLCGSPDHPAPFTADPQLDQAMVLQAEQAARALDNELIGESSRQTHLIREIEEKTETMRILESEHDLADLTADTAALDQRQRELETAGKQGKAELEDLLREKKELEEKRREADQKIQALAGAAQAYDEAREELTGLSVRLKDLQDRTQGMDPAQLDGDLTARRQEKSDLTAAIRAAETAFQQSSQQVAGQRSTLTSLTEQIGALTETIARQELAFSKDLSRLDLSLEEYLGLEKDLVLEKQLKESAETFFRELEQDRTRHEMMVSKLKGKTRIDLDALKTQIQENQEQESSVSAACDDCIRRESGLSHAAAKTASAVADYKKWNDQRAIASRLDLTTGKGTTFENYVLGYYLDGVLINANARLKSMTSNRFHLIRQSQDSGGRRAIEGLDLNVFDTYSNSQRDVKTLSGGEGFKASLALALGLSDFIQENKSGIRLDTIFIDEGFGTLDHESLDSAMETILELQGLGRLVGIISHVEELKERIPTQIVVENRREEGSVVKIVKH